MLVYSSKNVRGTAGFESLCFEPENEDDCKAIDTIIGAMRLMTKLQFLDEGSSHVVSDNTQEPVE